MNGRISLTIFLALCILACALAARSPSSYPRYTKKRVASSRIGESYQAKSSAPVASSSSSSTSSSSSSDSSSADSKSKTGDLIKVAKAIARSHSTSEVLTLNLTNLLILIVLKAVIFGIGLFYFGGVTFKGGHGNGWSSRSIESKSSSFMTEGELLLMLTYLLGASNENYECMYRVACEDPSKAKEYLNVSKMIVKGAKFMKKYVSYNPKYENIVYGLQSAVDHKNKGGDCAARYVCSDVPSL